MSPAALLLTFVMASSSIEAAPDPCPAPADLPASVDAAYAAPPDGGADLAPPAYRLPERIEIPLELYLPPPAPFGSRARLGQAAVDRRSGDAEFPVAADAMPKAAPKASSQDCR